MEPAQTERIVQLFHAEDQPGAPGAALAVVRDGEVVLEHCYGLANLEHKVPIGPHTGFHLVSLTKMFTAAARVSMERVRGVRWPRTSPG